MACETAWDVLCSVVGAGKFWGCEGFLPEFPQTCPKKIWATFCANIFSQQTLFWNDLQKKVAMWFCKSWAPFFSNQTRFGAIFTQIFRDFANVCTDFHGFCPESYQSYQIKTFGGALEPPPPIALMLASVGHIKILHWQVGNQLIFWSGRKNDCNFLLHCFREGRAKCL